MQLTGPRVEQLDRLGSRDDLRPQRCDGQVGEPVEQGVPEARVAEHEPLGRRPRARRTALDEVAGHRERGAGEADQRNGELLGEDPHGLEDVGRVGLRVERSEPVEVGRAAKGVSDDRARAGSDVHPEADGGHGHDDVGVEDGGVDAVPPDRLEGDLGRQLGVGDGRQDRALAADGPVLGQVTTGLAHEPHGRVRGRLAPARGQEDVVDRRRHAGCNLAAGLAVAGFNLAVAGGATQRWPRCAQRWRVTPATAGRPAGRRPSAGPAG